MMQILGVLTLAALPLVPNGALGSRLSPVRHVLQASVQELDWMSGRWTTSVWGGSYDEVWLDSVGGTTQGVGRFVKDGKLRSMEFDTLESNADGGIDLWVMLGPNSSSKRKQGKFALVDKDGTRFVFESKENEFPRRIIYEKREGNHRFCRIEGTVQGKATHTDFDFQKR